MDFPTTTSRRLSTTTAVSTNDFLISCSKLQLPVIEFLLEFDFFSCSCSLSDGGQKTLYYWILWYSGTGKIFVFDFAGSFIDAVRFQFRLSTVELYNEIIFIVHKGHISEKVILILTLIWIRWMFKISIFKMKFENLVAPRAQCRKRSSRLEQVVELQWSLNTVFEYPPKAMFI